MSKPFSLRIRLGRRLTHVQVDRIQGQLLAVGYGGGVDSTAMLVLLHKRGIRPDVITFADVGDEKQATYDYLQNVMAPWLRKVGFPEITVVRNDATYDSIGAAMLKRKTLPSLAFGKHSCSQAFKAAPQETWMNSHQPAAIGWALGQKVVKLIGYDDSAADRKRCGKAEALTLRSFEKYTYAYPLQESGIDRAGCMALIREAGLPVPPKSSCVFCPAMKQEEILDLGEKEPAKLAHALKVEATWLAGPSIKGSTKGLGRRFSWIDFLRTANPTLLARLQREHDCGQEERAAIDAEVARRAMEPATV